MFSPISCSYCRRRKVRCSKEESGCRACLKKDIKCEYPSKFRSIELIKLKNQQVQQAFATTTTPERSSLPSTIGAYPQITNIPSESSTPSSSNNNNKPTSDQQQVDEIHSDIALYKNRIVELESKLNTTQDFLSIFDNSFTEGKHHGKNSVNCLEHVTMADSLPIAQRRSSSIAFTTQKKRFPRLIDNDDSNNLKLVKKCVDMFFNDDEFSYFADLYSKEEVTKFIEIFDDIKKWEHDEDMITLLTILIDVVKNFLNKTKEEPVFPQQSKKLRSIVSQYQQIVGFQPFESVNVLKSQIIMTNYFYYIMEFEKAWSLLFQAVANAYSLGVHITQGTVWIKLNLVEAVTASVCSRPNCINELSRTTLKLDDAGDEFQEIKFSQLLREKNSRFINSYIHKTELNYDSDVFELGVKFEVYTRFLNDKIDTILSDRAISKTLKNQKLQKAYFLLLTNCSSSIKLHFEYFESKEFSDDKCVAYLGDFLSILETSTFNKLHNLRDKFAALECLVYQFMLVFLRVLNHKSVLSILKPHTTNVDAHSEERLAIHLKSFKEYQRRLDLIFAKNPLYTNPRTLKAYEIISNVNLDQINPGCHLIPSSLNTENTSYTAKGYVSETMNISSSSSSSYSASVSNVTVRSSLRDLLNPETSSYSSSSSASYRCPASPAATLPVTIAPEKTLTGNIFEDAGLKYFVTDEIKSLLDDKNIMAAMTDITGIQRMDYERGINYLFS